MIRSLAVLALVAGAALPAPLQAQWSPDFLRDCVATSALFSADPGDFPPPWRDLHPRAFAERQRDDLAAGRIHRAIEDAAADALNRLRTSTTPLPAGVLAAFESQLRTMVAEANAAAAVQGDGEALVTGNQAFAFGRFMITESTRTNPITGSQELAGARLFQAADRVTLDIGMDAAAARTVCWTALGLNHLLAGEIGAHARDAIDEFFDETLGLWTSYHESRWSSYPWEWAIEGLFRDQRRDLRPPTWGLILLHPRSVGQLPIDSTLTDMRFTDAVWETLAEQTAILVDVLGFVRYNDARSGFAGVAVAGIFGNGIAAGGVSLESTLGSVTVAYGDRHDDTGFLFAASVDAVNLAGQAARAIFGARADAAEAWSRERERLTAAVEAARARIPDPEN